MRNLSDELIFKNKQIAELTERLISIEAKGKSFQFRQVGKQAQEKVELN